MRTRVPSDPVYEPKGERYAFSILQLTQDLEGTPATVDTYVCTLTQANFACPECAANT